MIYQLSDYVRTNLTFPNDPEGFAFDVQNQFIVGGFLPDDPIDVVVLRENQGMPANDMQDRQDIPVQFLARGETHGRARDLIFTVYNADCFSSELTDGRRFKGRNDFYFASGGYRIASFRFMQSPYDLGADSGGYVYTLNAMVTFGNI